jgi:glycerol-3-phosphate dehydrogenase (NAD(P)+)
MRTAVLGAGSWGTTFAKVVGDAGHPVTIVARREEVAREIREQGTNSAYLGDIAVGHNVTATTNAAEALEGAGAVILAVPADAILVSLMKGIERSTGKRMSEVIAEVTGHDPARIAVVSGPNLAKEIAQEQPTATVVAAPDAATAEAVGELSATSYFRPYTNTDVVGVELGGAVKNVIALAVGMCDGQGLGDNSKASIITRGLAETTRLALAMGAQSHTLAGLAGLGDLVATCASPLSRNRTFGRLLGTGLTVDEAVEETRQVAEGVKSASAVLALGQAHDVELPITQAVAAVIAGRLRVDELGALLLARKRKHEGPAT